MEKEKFLKLYADLPLGLRDEIILVLPEKGPITWNVAFLEVEQDTALSKEILQKLKDLEII